jgi:hypothetical protein
MIVDSRCARDAVRLIMILRKERQQASVEWEEFMVELFSEPTAQRFYELLMFMARGLDRFVFAQNDEAIAEFLDLLNNARPNPR